MTEAQWKAFAAFRANLAERCDAWSAQVGVTPDNPLGWLGPLQREAAQADGTPDYPLETPIVYNRALDALTAQDDIRLIVVGDNPGKDEQLAKNRRYLVGQAGKLGEGFFRAHPELGVDFRKHVIILNKSPIHTAKTKQLAWILKRDARFRPMFDETQAWMARNTAALQRALGCGLWLVGYGELRAGGLFARYAEELRARYEPSDDAVRVYQHFSMNRFSIDLRDHLDPADDLATNLRRLGLERRREILGW